jgi:hypothetical protein
MPGAIQSQSCSKRVAEDPRIRRRRPRDRHKHVSKKGDDDCTASVKFLAACLFRVLME